MSAPFQPKDSTPAGLHSAQQALWQKLKGIYRLAPLASGATDETMRLRLNELLSFLQNITKQGDWR